MSREAKYLNFAAVLILIVVTLFSQHARADRGTNLVQQNFKVTSKVRVFSKDGISVGAEVALNEYYSHDQQASKLEIFEQTFDDPVFNSAEPWGLRQGKINYYYRRDHNLADRQVEIVRARTGLHVSPSLDESQVCQTLTFSNGANKLVQDLFGSAAPSEAPELSAKQWLLLKLSEIPIHIIGPSKFLLLVDQNRDKLVRDQQYTKAVIRNHQVTKSSLSIDLGSNQFASMTVYMGRLSDDFMDDNDSASLELPLRIWCRLASNVELVVDYFSLDLIKPEGQYRHTRDAASNQIDMFTLPLGVGCSRSMRATFTDTWKTSQFQLEQKVVSFQVELSQQSNNFNQLHVLQSRSFVAYDGYASMLRLDTVEQPNGYNRLSAPKSTTIIHDIAAKRRYNIRRQQQLSSTSNNGSAQLDYLTAKSSEPDCLGTLALSSNGFESPYEPIIPFAKLVLMGRAFVRGVEVEVYEQTTRTLPELLFQHVTFRNFQDKQETSFGLEFESYFDKSRVDSIALPFVVTYFISFGCNAKLDCPRYQARAKLMRVNFNWRATLFYRAEIYDFLWQLVDAPNGDKQDELFGLSRLCSSLTPSTSLNKQRLSTVDELGQLAVELTFSETPTTSPLQTSELIELIQASPARNKAIIRGLAQSSSGSLTGGDIHDIQSRLFVSQPASSVVASSNSTQAPAKQATRQTIKILTTLRLTHKKPRLYIPTSLGRGTYFDDQTRNYLHPHIATFADCFWAAARLQAKQGSYDDSSEQQLVFSYCQSECVIDPGARLEFSSPKTSPNNSDQHVQTKPKLVKSDVFTLNAAYTCEILHLEVVADSAGLGQQTKSWSYIYYNFKNKIITLPLIDQRPGDDSDVSKSVPLKQPTVKRHVTNLFFWITRLELNNVKWWQADDEDLEETVGTKSRHLLSDEQQAELFRGVAFRLFDESGSNQRRLFTVRLGEEPGGGSIAAASPAGASLVRASFCRESCLADLACESYSVCVYDQRIECLLSSFDGLSDATFLDRLADAKRKFKQSPGEFSLNYSGGSSSSERPEDSDSSTLSRVDNSIKIKLDNRCHAYVKRPLELFKQLARSTRTLVDRNTLAARDEDECARMCLSRNVNYFKRMQRAREKLTRNGAGGSEMVVRRESPGEWRREILDEMRYWCASFKFVNIQQSTLTYKELGRIGLDKTTRGGLCSLARPRWAPRTNDREPTDAGLEKSETGAAKGGEAANDDDDNEPKAARDKPLVRVEMETFEFDYAKLYQRFDGVRLLRGQAGEVSRFDGTECAQKVEVLTGGQSADYCARACFSQSVGLEPWCRSFDLVEQIVFADIATRNRSAKWTRTCVFSSAMLNDLAADEQHSCRVDSAQEAHLKFWHFEPHRVYTLDNVAVASWSRFGAAETQRGGTWSRLLIVAFAIASGSTLAVVYGPSWARRRRGQSAAGSALIDRDQLQL